MDAGKMLSVLAILLLAVLSEYCRSSLHRYVAAPICRLDNTSPRACSLLRAPKELRQSSNFSSACFRIESRELYWLRGCELSLECFS